MQDPPIYYIEVLETDRWPRWSGERESLPTKTKFILDMLDNCIHRNLSETDATGSHRIYFTLHTPFAVSQFTEDHNDFEFSKNFPRWMRHRRDNSLLPKNSQSSIALREISKTECLVSWYSHTTQFPFTFRHVNVRDRRRRRQLSVRQLVQ